METEELSLALIDNYPAQLAVAKLNWKGGKHAETATNRTIDNPIVTVSAASTVSVKT